MAESERPGLASRVTAARLLAAIVDKKTPADGLTDDRHGHPQYLALEARDRALVRAILATALRFRVTIGKMLGESLDRPLPSNAKTLNHVFHVAIAQMLFLDVPDRAAVDLAVAHAGSDPRTKRFTALVNGVLRSIGRRKDKRLPVLLEQTVDAPDWFAQRLVEVYGPRHAGDILQMHRLPALIDLTVKSDPEHWAEVLGGMVTPTGSVRLANVDGTIAGLAGYEEGEWWVQDAAAALPARIFGSLDGLRVADLCAAPGGKTAQLAMAGAKVTAVDISQNRLNRLAINLQRLKLEAELVVCDLRKFEPAEPFDAVLLDTPCSSTGTVRRHPDVPWTKSIEDIDKLAELQLELLRLTPGLVRPGGRIVFSNCSLDPAEGEVVAERFLADAAGVKPLSIKAGDIEGTEPFLTERGYLRTTPAGMTLGDAQTSGMDGFFAAHFVKDG